MKISFFAFIFVSFLLPIAQAQNKSTDEKAIQTLVNQFNAAFNAHDPKTFSMVFAEDTDVTNWLGKTVHGRTAVQELMTFVFQKMHPVTKQTLQPASIRFLTPDLAQVDIRAMNEGAFTPNGKPDPIGYYLLNWTVMREQDTWRIKVFHNTRLPQEPAPIQVAPTK